MKKYNAAILGATGVVGRQMLQCLLERDFPLGEVRLLASAKSAGQSLSMGSREFPVSEATEDSFKGMDFVFGAVQNPLARRFSQAIVAAGAVFIDNSSAFRMDDDVPLVIPEINSEDVFRNKGIIANPNCSTIMALMAISGIRRITGITKMVASTYQAVSGAGIQGMEELDSQICSYATSRRISGSSVFPCQIFSNVIPQIGSPLENGYTTEEMKMQNEGRKILHLPELKVCCTCVRVPVLRSHSVAVQIVTTDPISVPDAKAAIASAPGCRLIDETSLLDGRAYPTPLDTSDQDLVYVGRVRRDLIDDDRGLALWCCGDQIRKGAATNAVQIAEVLITRE